MNRLFATLLLLLSALTAAPASAEPPRVVASIAPLHSLVAGVMQGVGEPYLLLSGGASPHSYSLRPSDARALEQADLVVWVGEVLESFLERPVAALGGGKRTIELARLPEAVTLASRAGGAWEPHEAHGHDHGHGHAEHGDDSDPHLWLDPANARALVDATAEALAELDPANAGVYAANRERLLQRLQALETALRERLEPLHGIPYVVFHDAYHYFEARFGLEPAGAISIDPERRPGARRLLEIRQTIRDLNARCVFSEPQFRPALAEVVLEGSEANHGVLDPVGAQLRPGPELYFALLEGLAASLETCLAER